MKKFLLMVSLNILFKYQYVESSKNCLNKVVIEDKSSPVNIHEN